MVRFGFLRVYFWLGLFELLVWALLGLLLGGSELVVDSLVLLFLLICYILM